MSITHAVQKSAPSALTVVSDDLGQDTQVRHTAAIGAPADRTLLPQMSRLTLRVRSPDEQKMGRAAPRSAERGREDGRDVDELLDPSVQQASVDQFQVDIGKAGQDRV